MIRVALRLDDPSETSHRAVEAGILDALRSHGACATFAVIPFRMVDNQLMALSTTRALPLIEAAQAGVIEVALHGHAHARFHPESAIPSEFAGRPEADQDALITEGRSHIESVFGQSVIGFVPPWNSYDVATLSVLERQRFHYVSAGLNITDGYSGELKLLPLTAHLRDVPAALAEARRFHKAGPVIVVVMHHFDFVESGVDGGSIDLQGFAALLANLSAQPDVTLCKLADVSTSFSHTVSSIRQHRLRSRYSYLRRLLPRHCILNAPLWQALLAGAMKR
jgi:peptidoglycan/xylan/chitin deacetylase (PgdA/CDA1 family)